MDGIFKERASDSEVNRYISPLVERRVPEKAVSRQGFEVGAGKSCGIYFMIGLSAGTDTRPTPKPNIPRAIAIAIAVSGLTLNRNSKPSFPTILFHHLLMYVIGFETRKKRSGGSVLFLVMLYVEICSSDSDFVVGAVEYVVSVEVLINLPDWSRAGVVDIL